MWTRLAHQSQHYCSFSFPLKENQLEAFDRAYLSLDAKSSVFYDQGVLGELVEQVLPLTGQLTKRTLGYKENAPEKESRIRYI